MWRQRRVECSECDWFGMTMELTNLNEPQPLEPRIIHGVRDEGGVLRAVAPDGGPGEALLDYATRQDPRWGDHSIVWEPAA